MLADSDRHLVQRDRALPALATLLDPDAFGQVLRDLPGTEASIGQPRPTYLRYKPGTSCLAGFEVPIDGRPVDVHAATFRDATASKLFKPAQRPQSPGPMGPGVWALEHAGLMVSFFPNDAPLRALRQIGEATSLRHFLTGLLPEHPPLWEGKLTKLTYKPQRRYVGKLSIDGRPRAVVRFYHRQDYAASVRRAKVIQPVTAFNVAPILGRRSRHGVIALGWSPGRPLSEVLIASDLTTSTRAVQATGAALAALHGQRLSRLPQTDPMWPCGSLLESADSIAWVCPHLADWARQIARQTADQLGSPPAEPSPIHGDFYASQVLLDDENNLALIDYDRTAQGDPASDLGNFLAHLDRLALHGRLPADRIDPLADGLLEGYRSEIHSDLSSPVAAHRAAGLFRLAPHCFRNREPDWPQRTEAILEHAHRLLNDAAAVRALRPARCVDAGPARSNSPCLPVRSSSPSVRVTDIFNATLDPSMPFLVHALDPAEAQHAIEQLDLSLLPEATDCRRPQLCAIRVVRHKPKRRCLVEYDLVFPSTAKSASEKDRRVTLIGKARARGLHRSAYELAVQLHRHGFDDQSPDGISVPQPVGVIPEFRMWLQRKVDAVPATRWLTSRGGVDLCVQMAQAIDKVHSCGIPSRKAHTIEDELRILHLRLNEVADQFPKWQGRIKRVLEACDALGATLPETQPVGIHRDFYPDQVLIGDGRLYLVDFDLYCQGDPALDVGNFIGHLTELALRTLGDPTAWVGLEHALEEAFVRRWGPQSRFSVRAYAALTIVRHIHITTRIPERRPWTQRWLSLCEQRLGIRTDPGSSWESCHPIQAVG